MKHITLALIGIAALALVACSKGTSDTLNGGPGGEGGDHAGNGDTSFDHHPALIPGVPAPGLEVPAPGQPQLKIIGSPEVTSRLHACGKLSVASLGSVLASRGLTGGGARPASSPSGQAIYAAVETAPALGAANYPGRVGESAFATTGSMAKMFDIFTMSSYDAVADSWTAPACPGVKVLVDGKFTKDGLTCLMGKPASDAHLAVANQAIVQNPTDGAKLAIAALLSAAHTCQ